MCALLFPTQGEGGDVKHVDGQTCHMCLHRADENCYPTTYIAGKS